MNINETERDYMQRSMKAAEQVLLRLFRGELLTIAAISEVFGADKVYPLIYAEPPRPPDAHWRCKCDRCGHLYSVKCEACPFCLSAWTMANARSTTTISARPPTLNPFPCANCDRPEICRVIATCTRPCDQRS